MSDELDQSDEIMALQSIYEEDIFVCDTSAKPHTGQIWINLNADGEDLDFSCEDVVIPMKHVTPLKLNFSLPNDYPSVSPPEVELSCLWLTDEQLKRLTEILMERWIENGNSAILYVWMDLIKNESLKLLDVQFPITISEENMVKLTEESIAIARKIFDREFHFCPVCFMERPGTECVKLTNCEHVFCKECLLGFILVHISEGSVNAIVCPSADCDDQVYPNVIKSLVSGPDFERYDRLLLQNAFDIMSDICYCPRIKCNKPVIINNNDNMGFCHSCNLAFCLRCKLTYHGVEGCKWELRLAATRAKIKREAKEEKIKELIVPEDLGDGAKKIYKEEDFSARKSSYWYIPDEERASVATDYMEGDKEIRLGLVEYYGRAMIKEMLEDYKSVKWMKDNTRKCPNCTARIQKIIGCNKMQCTSCKGRFCWVCGVEIKNSNPYEHFSNTLSPCYNLLAENVVLNNVEDDGF